MAFDENKASRVIRFIECLCHTKGEFHGQPLKLLSWQKKTVGDVFGTVRDDDPTMRQYTTAYVEIPKKQGKSELGAAIALNMLVNDDEWKAEVYSCASDRQQASIVFDVAVDMVRQSPALSRRIKIIPSIKIRDEQVSLARKWYDLTYFVSELREREHLLEEWDDTTWVLMLERASVYKDNRGVFQFKNGIQIAYAIE